jgi:hypothetical protein
MHRHRSLPAVTPLLAGRPGKIMPSDCILGCHTPTGLGQPGRDNERGPLFIFPHTLCCDLDCHPSETCFFRGISVEYSKKVRPRPRACYGAAFVLHIHSSLLVGNSCLTVSSRLVRLLTFQEQWASLSEGGKEDSCFME